MISKSLMTHQRVINRSASLITRGQTTTATVTKTSDGSVKSYADIPGPKPLPIVGNAWRFLPRIGTIDMTDFKKFSSDIRKEYGDIIKISNLPGRKDMLMIFDPDSIAEVFKNEGQWPERFILESFQHFRTEVRPDFFEGNQGIANENGEKWQAARTVINQPMMKVSVSNLYVPKSDEVAKDFVKLVKKLRQSNMELPEYTRNELNKWALESICMIALDTRLGCLEEINLAKDSDAQRMIDAVGNVIQLGFELDFKVIMDIAYKYVEQARRKIKDLDGPETPEMSVLHRILKRDPHTKRAVIMGMDLVMAGVDTTSSSTSITLYYLSKNPDKQEILYQEIKDIVPSDRDQLITSEHLDKMKYLKACIKEAIRLTPVAPANLRILHKDVVLNNYLIPKGQADILMLNGHLYGDDKFFPQAEKFIPERWLRDESAQCPVRKAHETHPYVYLPFGHGVRACPGVRFAYMEMETLISRLLLDFKIEWHQPEMKFNSKLLQMPSSPLKFTLLDRI